AGTWADSTPGRARPRTRNPICKRRMRSPCSLPRGRDTGEDGTPLYYLGAGGSVLVELGLAGGLSSVKLTMKSFILICTAPIWLFTGLIWFLTLTASTASA